MNQEQFKKRTKDIALRVIKLSEVLPNTHSGNVISRQIIRSSTSVGANYRAACRAKSPADMINKLKIVEEEADETQYWLELIIESKMLPEIRISGLIKEINEILAMTVTSIKTLRRQSSIVNRQYKK